MSFNKFDIVTKPRVHNLNLRSHSKKSSLARRIKTIGMKIFDQFLPLSYALDLMREKSSFWSWGLAENADRWWGLPNHAKEIQIPIHREDICEDCHCWCNLSDCDSYSNTNNSGSNVKRKRHKNSYHSSLYDDDNDVIEIDDTEKSAQKIPILGNCHKQVNKQTSIKSPCKIPKWDILQKQVSRKSEIAEDRLKSEVTESVCKPSCSSVIDIDSETDINETCSYSVYKCLKEFLKRTGREIDSIIGDGNCFFRAVSKILYGNQRFYGEIRHAVVDVMDEYPEKFEAFTDEPISKHIKEMRADKVWATQTEIYAAATLLNRDIYILSPEYDNGRSYRWLLFKPQFSYNKTVTGCRCYITLCHTHGNHYDRIVSETGKCNCSLSAPELSGVKAVVDLTCNEDEII